MKNLEDIAIFILAFALAVTVTVFIFTVAGFLVSTICSMINGPELTTLQAALLLYAWTTVIRLMDAVLFELKGK